MKLFEDNQFFSHEIQRIADKVKTDVENELKRVFKNYDAPHKAITNKENRKHKPKKTFSKKEKASDLSLQPFNPKRFLFDDLITPFEEDFFNRDNFFGSSWGPLDMLPSNEFIETLTEEFEKDWEKLNELAEEDNDSSFFMKIKTNDNGHVRVKTIKKLPKSDVEAKEVEYFVGKPALKSNKKKLKALKNKQEKEKKEVEEQVESNEAGDKKNQVIIEDVTNSSSEESQK